MAAAQRKGWAAARKPKVAAATPAPAGAAGKKRRLGPEGRADHRGDEEAGMAQGGQAAAGDGGGDGGERAGRRGMAGAARKRPEGVGRASQRSFVDPTPGRSCQGISRQEWHRTVAP